MSVLAAAECDLVWFLGPSALQMAEAQGDGTAQPATQTDKDMAAAAATVSVPPGVLGRAKTGGIGAGQWLWKECLAAGWVRVCGRAAHHQGAWSRAGFPWHDVHLRPGVFQGPLLALFTALADVWSAALSLLPGSRSRSAPAVLMSKVSDAGEESDSKGRFGRWYCRNLACSLWLSACRESLESQNLPGPRSAN